MSLLPVYQGNKNIIKGIKVSNIIHFGLIRKIIRTFKQWKKVKKSFDELNKCVFENFGRVFVSLFQSEFFRLDNQSCIM